MRLREGMMCLLVLIVQFPEAVPAVMEIIQPSFAVGIIGKTTSFNCRLMYHEGKVSRNHLYVYYMNASNYKTVVHPSTDDHSKKKFNIISNGDQTDKSIQISDLHFNDTEKYFCMMSVVGDKGSKPVTGNGTLLFVHGPVNLKEEFNDTVVCDVQVKIVEDFEIVWAAGDTEIAAGNITVVTADLGTYRIFSRLSVNSEPTNPDLTTNITCLLRHKSGGHISQHSMNISGRFFAQKRTREEPLLLYVLPLTGRLLLLLVILVFFKFKNRSKRQRP